MVIANPHPDDKEYHKSIGKNYYPTDVDISGNLHDKYAEIDQRNT